MRSLKISSNVDEQAWNDLRYLAQATGRPISRVLTDAMVEYLHRHRLRPVVLEHLDRSIDDNEELGRRLGS